MAATEEDRTATAAGRGVDADGGPVIDPSQNVLDLVRAEARRQDDLRLAAEKMAELRASHAKELRKAEAKRVDALRAGDQGALVTLAASVTATAEALRAAATAQADQFTKQLDELQRFQYGQQGSTANVADSRARSGTVALWVGLAFSILFGIVSIVVAAVGLTR